MANHVYGILPIVGTSPESIEKAVQNALAKARESIKNIRWFEVVETRGYVESDTTVHWQVTIKIGHSLD
jgi:flavin-binding protein dodecin